MTKSDVGNNSNYVYRSTSDPHAVTGYGAQSDLFEYDVNGQMIKRFTKAITYDAQEQLISYDKDTHVYDGDGNRMMTENANGEATVFIYYYNDLGLGTCGEYLCTIYVSEIITKGGGWKAKDKDCKEVNFEYGCQPDKHGIGNPYIFTPNFKTFMGERPDVEVLGSYSMSDYTPDLFKPGDVVLLKQGSIYNHAVFVVEVTTDLVKIVELSGSAQPPTYQRDFDVVNTQIISFVIIRIKEYYP